MAKICRRVTRKSYYGKSEYEYVTLWLYLPKKYYEMLRPHVGVEMNITVHERNGQIQITLTPKPSTP